MDVVFALHHNWRSMPGVPDNPGLFFRTAREIAQAVRESQVFYLIYYNSMFSRIDQSSLCDGLIVTLVRSTYVERKSRWILSIETVQFQGNPGYCTPYTDPVTDGLAWPKFGRNRLFSFADLTSVSLGRNFCDLLDYYSKGDVLRRGPVPLGQVRVPDALHLTCIRRHKTSCTISVHLN